MGSNHSPGRNQFYWLLCGHVVLRESFREEKITGV